jgi:hypothetical protein
MQIKKRRRYNPAGAARKELAFPQINAKGLGTADLIGYHSYLNWLSPTLQLGRSLRLSLLLFDKVIAETDFDDLPERGLNMLVSEGRLDRKACQKLLHLIVPITRFVPEFGTRDLFRSPEDRFLDIATEHYLDNEYLSKRKTPPDFLERQFRDVRYTLTVSAFENWFALSRQIDCLFIPNDYEEVILESFLKFLESPKAPSAAGEYGTFKSLVTRLLPAIEELSVEEILALRQHEYFASFRRKTREIVDRVSSRGDLNRIIEDEEQTDRKALEDLFRPKPVPTLLRAIIGNLPIPMLVNPVSAYDAVTSTRRDAKAARDLGWLYFVRDLNEARERAKHFRTGDILGLR